VDRQDELSHDGHGEEDDDEEHGVEGDGDGGGDGDPFFLALLHLLVPDVLLQHHTCHVWLPRDKMKMIVNSRGAGKPLRQFPVCHSV
jgi:hypothetical protein